jgi:hypothetical protein
MDAGQRKAQLREVLAPRFWALYTQPGAVASAPGMTFEHFVAESSVFYCLESLEESKQGRLDCGRSVVCYSCTCEWYARNRACMHSIGLALKNDVMTVPPFSDTTPLPGHQKLRSGKPTQPLGGRAYQSASKD